MSGASPGAPAACSSAHPRITGPRSSSSATVTSTVLRGLPCALSRYTATADGLNSATATHRQPRRARAAMPGPPHCVVSRHQRAPVPPTRFTEPATVSMICPVSSTSTRSTRVHIEEVVAHQHRGVSVTGQHQRHRHAERQAQRSARPGGLAQHERRRRRLPGDQRPEVRLVHIGGDRDQRQHHEPRPNRRGHINPAGQHKSRPIRHVDRTVVVSHACRVSPASYRPVT